MNNNPKEFFDLVTDTTGNRKQRNLKSKASRILENLCDLIEGSSSFVIPLCLYTVDWMFTKDF